MNKIQAVITIIPMKKMRKNWGFSSSEGHGIFKIKYEEELIGINNINTIVHELMHIVLWLFPKIEMKEDLEESITKDVADYASKLVRDRLSL